MSPDSSAPTHDQSGSGQHGPLECVPHVGKPLDGSQYRNIIEEQIYSELPPTAEEQQPLHARHLAENKIAEKNSQAHDAQLSVGNS